MFERQVSLIGKNQQNLKDKSVLIVGSGGLGNSVATNLGCIGLKGLYLIDHDTIENHNIPRQFHFTTENVGEKKAEVLAKKVLRCDTKIEGFSEKFSQFVKRGEQFDLIIDCTDNFEVRLEIDRYAKEIDVPWLYGSVEGWLGQYCLFNEASFSAFNTGHHSIKGVFPATVNALGSLQSITATRFLSGLEVETDTLFFVDFEKNSIKKFIF